MLVLQTELSAIFSSCCNQLNNWRFWTGFWRIVVLSLTCYTWDFLILAKLLSWVIPVFELSCLRRTCENLCPVAPPHFLYWLEYIPIGINWTGGENLLKDKFTKSTLFQRFIANFIWKKGVKSATFFGIILFIILKIYTVLLLGNQNIYNLY